MNNIFDKTMLSGQNAVVTGASRGIGYAVATALAEVGEAHPLPRRDHRVGEHPDLRALHAALQHGHRERRHLRIRDVAARERVDHPTQRIIGDGAAIALRADHIDGVERLDGGGHRTSSRDRGPNASGSTSSMVRMPETVSSSISALACSYSS